MGDLKSVLDSAGILTASQPLPDASFPAYIKLAWQLVTLASSQPGTREGDAAEGVFTGERVRIAPSETLFSGIGGEPVPPEAQQQPIAEDFWQQTAGIAIALARLVQHCKLAGFPVGTSQPQSEQFAPTIPTLRLQPVATARSQPRVLVEELPSDDVTPAAAAGDQLPCLQMLLLIALYANDQQLVSPWTAPQVAQESTLLLHQIAAASEDRLGASHRPSEDHSAQQGLITPAPLTNQAAYKSAGCSQSSSKVLFTGSVRRNLGSSTESCTASQPAQDLLTHWFPQLATHVKGVLVQRAHAEGQKLEAYTGPGTFERTLAARQLAWWIRSLDFKHLSLIVGQALPCVLAAVDDSSPPVQCMGLWALHHLVTEALPSSLSWQRELLLHVARRVIVGCDSRVWPAAAQTACAIACCLCGDDAFSEGYKSIMLEMLSQGERFAHQLAHRLVWLTAMRPLVQGMGLATVAHIRRLLPLLLPWCCSPDAECQLLALQLLHVVALHTWPRLGAHVCVLLKTLQAAEEEYAARGKHGPAEMQACIAREIQDARRMCNACIKVQA